MKWFLLWVAILPLGAAELSGVHTVYMLSMANGMDQYLANRLTGQHVLQVVTDPQRADAIFTDRIGQSLEDRLDDLYPPPEAKEAPKSKEGKPADAKPAEAKPKEPQPKAKAPEKPADETPVTPGVEPVNKIAKVGSMTSFGRSKGTLFLVDVKSRQVLWSIYERPKDTSSRQLDRTALRIVERLKQEAAGKTEHP